MTELIWDGKYDKDGKRVAPLRVALPFQTVETVNEDTKTRNLALEMFSAGRDPEWRNRLIWGDKKYVLPSLLDEFAGKVNLVYIDPPFNVGADFSFTATIPDNPDDDEAEATTFLKEPSMIEVKAYRDTWGVNAEEKARGMTSLDRYLRWFYETVVLLRELLAQDGSIYVHLDWHTVHYAKAVMDEVLGLDNALNQITWKRIYSHSDAGRYGIVDDTLLFYSKSGQYTFNKQFRPHAESYIKSHYGQVDEKGRPYRLVTLSAAGPGAARRFGDKVIAPPKGRHWAWSQDNIDEGLANGKIVFASTGQPNVKQYLDDTEGTVIHTIWDDIQRVNPVSPELLDYPTQKPEALLERIIKASSNESDLVLDCFVGSGTTAAVAEKNDRRWIACDLGRFAIHTTRKRLLSIDNVRPFVVQNLGKYERQAWQAAEFGDRVETRNLNYRRFILDLYKARPITGYAWLHGINHGKMVHIGSVDAPISVGDVANIVSEFKRAVGTGKDAPTSNGVDILGWDFAFELNEVARQQAAQAKINVRFVRIPREVLDPKAVEQGDIRFFELAALSVDVKRKKCDVTLTLTDFVIPPDDVPQDVQKAIKHWSQWIDYWAVDWDNKGDTFHNEWQTYRTRKNPDLQKSAAHTYPASGEYTVVVKVIDILGNDTTKSVRIKINS